jgi:hypothetical protein
MYTQRYFREISANITTVQSRTSEHACFSTWGPVLNAYELHSAHEFKGNLWPTQLNSVVVDIFKTRRDTCVCLCVFGLLAEILIPWLGAAMCYTRDVAFEWDPQWDALRRLCRNWSRAEGRRMPSCKDIQDTPKLQHAVISHCSLVCSYVIALNSDWLLSTVFLIYH